MKTIHSLLLSRASNAGGVAIYKSLMQAYLSSSGNTAGQAVSESKNDLDIDGIDFSLAYLPKVDPQALQISAAVLQIMPSQEASLYPKILSSNFYLHPKISPVLALSPHAPIVLALMRLSLRQVTLPLLDQALKNMAQAVTKWKTELLE